MSTRTLRRATATLAVASILALTGCGDDGSSDGGSEGGGNDTISESTSESTSSEPPAESGSEEPPVPSEPPSEDPGADQPDTADLKPFTGFPAELGGFTWQKAGSTPDGGTYLSPDGILFVTVISSPGPLESITGVYGDPFSPIENSACTKNQGVASVQFECAIGLQDRVISMTGMPSRALAETFVKDFYQAQ